MKCLMSICVLGVVVAWSAGCAPKRVEVPLDYGIVMGYEVVLTKNNRWIGAVVPSRTYFDVAETGGAAPALIVDFGDKTGAQSLSLSPTGDRIVFSVAEFKESGIDLTNFESKVVYKNYLVDILGCNIHRVSVAGGAGIEQITPENYLDMYPVYTANDEGMFLLFSTNRRRPTSGDILRLNAQTRGAISNIYVNHRDALTLKPSQARDGTIAFGVHPDDANQFAQIWTVGGPNNFPTQITRGTQPQISPDGKLIAYIGTDGNLWVIGTDGSAATQLTGGSGDIIDRFRKSLTPAERGLYDFFETSGVKPIVPFSSPSWTPDGRYILFTSMEGNDPTGRPNEDIWIVGFDGTSKQQLTTNGSTDRFPLMSPDKKSIYFMSNRGKRWAIWRIEAPPLSGAAGG